MLSAAKHEKPQGLAVGIRSGFRQAETPDTRGLASGGLDQRDLIFSHLKAGNLFTKR